MAEDIPSTLARSPEIRGLVEPGDKTIELFPNEVKLVRFDKPFSTVVVGEPRIADATAQGDMLILTGKAPGRTTVIVLDSGNNELMKKRVVVSEFTGIDRVTVNSASRKEGSLQVNVSIYGCAKGRLCELLKSPEGSFSSLPKGSSVSVPVGSTD
jgi:hypothetical protein